MIYVDLDDFCEDNHSLALLRAVKEEIPQFRVTLFAIPGLCDPGWIQDMMRCKWWDLVPHGWTHPTPRECEHWTLEQARTLLGRIDPLGMTRGFKAPGWQISDATYQALHERGYWVADQTYNNARRPAGLRTYLLDSPNKIHGHIGHLGGHNANELSLILPEILKHRHEEFGFVRDATV